jgi:acetyl esterase/lipase
VSATGVGSATITASADGVTSNPVTVTVSEGTEPLPAILYLHSGAWFQGTREEFHRQAAHMATKGFVGATIQYRLIPQAYFPAQVQDSKTAVRWLRANASTYRIDTDRIGVTGGSAGGYLAAMLGTTPHIAEFEGDGGNPGFSSRVQAVAAFNGPHDFVAGRFFDESSDYFIEDFLGASYDENPELWVKASPITYVGPESPPFLFLHGTADGGVPYQQSVDMMNALMAAGVSAELFTAQYADHADLAPNSPFWGQSTLEAMEEFFVRILK